MDLERGGQLADGVGRLRELLRVARHLLEGGVVTAGGTSTEW